MKRVALALALLSASTWTHADFDGNKIVEWANADDRTDNRTGNGSDNFSSGVLYGYVAGIFDAENYGNVFCPPPNTTVGQNVAIVKKYVRANPEMWNIQASWLIIGAFRTAYPCRKK